MSLTRSLLDLGGGAAAYDQVCSWQRCPRLTIGCPLQSRGPGASKIENNTRGHLAAFKPVKHDVHCR